MEEKGKQHVQRENAAEEVKTALKGMLRGREKYLHSIFNQAYSSASYAERLVHDPELLNLRLSDESLAEVIAVAHPDMAMKKMIENKHIREKLDYSALASVVSIVVEHDKDGKYSRTIIEKYPDLLHLVDTDSETDYTVVETIAIMHPELKALLNEKGYKL